MDASAASRPAPRRPALPGSVRLLRLASDERLVAQVRAGSQVAFEAIFDRHHRGILAFCRHMLGSAEEAEDAVQHTFMAAYRDMVSSVKEIQLRAWLYTIARNRCLTLLRGRRERPLGELDEPSTESLSAEVERRQDLRELLVDLAGLPEEQRSALVLAEVGAVSHDEIAVVLGVPREKVKALVFQARSSLPLPARPATLPAPRSASSSRACAEVRCGVTPCAGTCASAPAAATSAASCRRSASPSRSSCRSSPRWRSRSPRWRPPSAAARRPRAERPRGSAAARRWGPRHRPAAARWPPRPWSLSPWSPAAPPPA